MSEPVVKICGLKSLEAAECAVNSGANLLGVILVPNRARTIDDETLIQISKLAKTRQKLSSRELLLKLRSLNLSQSEYFKTASKLIIENGPYLVGVFRNQTLETIKEKIATLDLDFIQLHGSENFKEYIDLVDVPVIARYVLNSANILDSILCNQHILPLFDSELGGEGKLIDWEDAKKFGNVHNGEYLLAGGLTAENVSSAIKVSGCLGVDVAGGVETDGVKDLDKIKFFIENAKNCT